MSTSSSTTEEKILATAKDIFVQKGFTGTRMQEIADAAGINKAMLHYYFRSKEKLFQQILAGAITQFSPLMLDAISGQEPVMTKLQKIVDCYFEVLIEHPYLPLFVMHELSQNQGKFVSELIGKDDPQEKVLAFFQQVIEEGEAGIIRKINPIHLLMNTMSLIIFPFVSRPSICTATGLDSMHFESLLRERPLEIMSFLTAALRP